MRKWIVLVCVFALCAAATVAAQEPESSGSGSGLAFVALPVVMVGAIITYGFVVWFLQILFFGPPS